MLSVELRFNTRFRAPEELLLEEAPEVQKPVLTQVPELLEQPAFPFSKQQEDSLDGHWNKPLELQDAIPLEQGTPLLEEAPEEPPEEEVVPPPEEEVVPPPEEVVVPPPEEVVVPPPEEVVVPPPDEVVVPPPEEEASQPGGSHAQLSLVHLQSKHFVNKPQ